MACDLWQSMVESLPEPKTPEETTLVSSISNALRLQITLGSGMCRTHVYPLSFQAALRFLWVRFFSSPKDPTSKKERTLFFPTLEQSFCDYFRLLEHNNALEIALEYILRRTTLQSERDRTVPMTVYLAIDEIQLGIPSSACYLQPEDRAKSDPHCFLSNLRSLALAPYALGEMPICYMVHFVGTTESELEPLITATMGRHVHIPATLVDDTAIQRAFDGVNGNPWTNDDQPPANSVHDWPSDCSIARVLACLSGHFRSLEYFLDTLGSETYTLTQDTPIYPEDLDQIAFLLFSKYGTMSKLQGSLPGQEAQTLSLKLLAIVTLGGSISTLKPSFSPPDDKSFWENLSHRGVLFQQRETSSGPGVFSFDGDLRERYMPKRPTRACKRPPASKSPQSKISVKLKPREFDKCDTPTLFFYSFSEGKNGPLAPFGLRRMMAPYESELGWIGWENFCMLFLGTYVKMRSFMTTSKPTAQKYLRVASWGQLPSSRKSFAASRRTILVIPPLQSDNSRDLCVAYSLDAQWPPTTKSRTPKSLLGSLNGYTATSLDPKHPGTSGEISGDYWEEDVLQNCFRNAAGSSSDGFHIFDSPSTPTKKVILFVQCKHNSKDATTLDTQQINEEWDQVAKSAAALGGHQWLLLIFSNRRAPNLDLTSIHSNCAIIFADNLDKFFGPVFSRISRQVDQ